MLISNDVTYDWLGLLITFKYILVVIDYINIGTKAPHSTTLVLARSITLQQVSGSELFSHVQLRSNVWFVMPTDSDCVTTPVTTPVIVFTVR